MWRLSPPTRATFGVAVLAIAAGIVMQLGLVEVADIEELDDPAFWVTTAGGVLLCLGVLFRRI